MKMFRRQSNVQDVCGGDAVDKLLAAVKREVKQIMEEAVTKKFIHEDSASVTTLCGAVDTCLKYKLKKQSLGLFNNASSTTALLHKVAKTLEDAKETSKTVAEIESQNDPLSRFSLKNLTLDGTKTPPKQNGGVKYTWIRVALFNRVLATIVEYLVKHSSKYYEAASLIGDQSKGSLLSQLLEGPCALEYSRMKTSDHLFTDPNADELVLRHRLHSGASLVGQTSTVSPNKRPALGLGRARNNTSSSSEDSTRSVPVHAREYVESLHQNRKANLLYGKNNVRVLPREGDELLPGYLSLHQTCESLNLKWTPNQLINSKQSSTGDKLHTHTEETTLPSTEGRTENGFSSRPLSKQSSHEKACTSGSRFLSRRPQLMWDCAINVNMDEIVYLHCHHQGSCGGILIMVGVDGVQSPAFHFPYGGHLLAFLTCLETGLQPNARLDPPLWIHKDTGRIFPKLRKKLSGSDKSVRSTPPSTDADIDYVFRIVIACKPKALHELIDPRKLSILSLDTIKSFRLPWNSSSGRESPHRADSLDMYTNSTHDSSTHSEFREDIPAKPPLQTRDSLQRLCSTMKHRILSRAFYGWLAHCKHLKTVREHLSGLVYSGEVINPVPAENEKSLTREFWEGLSDKDMVLRQFEVYRRIYYGGISHSIRKQVWPYLLGHYKFGSTKADRQKRDIVSLRLYEDTRDEWMNAEIILKQRGTKSKPTFSSTGSSAAGDVVGPLPAGDNGAKRSFDRQISNLSNDSILSHNGSSTSGTQVFMDTVIVAEVGTEEFTQGTDRRPPLTKWHTYDSTYREDFCAVKMSMSYGGYKSEEMNGHHSADSPSPTDEELQKHNDKILEELDLNLHRIDKDVHRCDRTYWYFTENNLKKLRNVMCTYVWKNLEIGYIQGMCDLVAPLLVIFDDEALTYSCFCELMKRMVDNFPSGHAMDNHLANMRSLIRVLDPELFELMQHNGDYTHFFFCYRWLLLDFKREMCYDDVFLVWESIWSAKYVCSDSYVAFIALAMIEAYRDILLDNSMDFIDVMKFFNEMAEKHNAREVLSIARDLVHRLQSLIENK